MLATGCSAPGAFTAPLLERPEAPQDAAGGAPAADGEDAAQAAGEPEQEAEQATATETPPPAGAGMPVHGQASTSYRYRAVDGEADHDVTSSLYLDFGDAAEDDWTGNLQGWLSWDLGGGDGDAFTDISDTWSDSVTARLYTAYADYHGSERLETLRLGRQEIVETPAFVTFDGVRAESVELGEDKVQLEGYGGVPAHFFESSFDGDLVFGLAASARPWESGRLRLDWMHLEDEALLGDHVNDLWGLSVWQRVDERLRLDGRATMLEGEGRDTRVRATWADPESELTVLASYYVLFQEQNDLVQELDPFTATLLALEPFHRAQLLATQPLGEDFLVEGGYERREMLDADDEGQFNRDFGRLHAAATALDLAQRGLELRLMGELWDATGIETTSWGLDLSRTFDEAFETSLGSYFALYKQDLLVGEEREDVRTYYADLEWHRTRWTTFDVRYEFENAPGDDYHVARVGMRWNF